jgi:hypothetical protein
VDSPLSWQDKLGDVFVGHAADPERSRILRCPLARRAVYLEILGAQENFISDFELVVPSSFVRLYLLRHYRAPSVFPSLVN